MPHCIIEYSINLENVIKPQYLTEAVFQGACQTTLFPASDIKVRAFCYKNHLTGEKKIDFIHVTLRILSGRKKEQRKNLTTSVLNSLRTLDLSSVSITVEVCEIEKDTYAKVVL